MRSALWHLGFRPFFLFGSVFALIAVLIWSGNLAAVIPRIGAGDPVSWHSHEMIFGFAGAIVAGFVLTAVQNWTGVPGIKGRPLQFIFGIWVLARVLIALPEVPPLASAVGDLLFFPAVAFLLIPYFKDPELKTERIFFVFFAILFAGNLLFHLHALELVTGFARHGIYLGLNTIILVILFMGGRVIPFFTESSIAKRQPRTWPFIEVAGYASAAGYLVMDVFAFGTQLHIMLGFLAMASHLARLLGWQVRRVRRVPLIWVLHVAYLWIIFGFALGAMAGLGKLAPTIGVHAFTVGGLGIMIYGMITRVSLGHTGRRLHPTPWTVAGYVSLNLAAVSRVFGPLLFPDAYLHFIFASAAFWTIAFGIFIAGYTTILISPRTDGRPG